MQDDTFCGGIGERLLCCPDDLQRPKCGWYSHHNGNCDSTCPDGYVEVGSYAKDCKNINHYQAACCEARAHTAVSFVIDATALYNQCYWNGTAPHCGSDCGSSQSISQLTRSWSGSGGVNCLVGSGSHISAILNLGHTVATGRQTRNGHRVAGIPTSESSILIRTRINIAGRNALLARRELQ